MFDHVDAERRRQLFEKRWRKRWCDEVCLMPAKYQGRIHELLKQSYYAGSNDERRLQEPVKLGGDW